MNVLKIIVVTSLFFLVNLVNSQSYKPSFRVDMCDCLTLEIQKRKLTENAYKACFRETLPKYATLIDAQIVEEDINKKMLLGQLARKDLLISIRPELVYTCEAYFNHLESEKLSKKLIIREQARESDLEKFNQLVAMSPNTYSYFSRAQLHYNLGNLDAAETDIKSCIEINPNKDNIKSRRHELLLMALIHEERNNYTEAITLYDLAYFGEMDVEVAILRAVADKNNGGSIANIPKLKDSAENVLSSNKPSRRRSTTSNQTRSQSQNKTQTTQSIQSKKKKDTSSLKKLFKIDD
ncbi:tetratricopeptide repeat protein [Lacinutrix venerupis]|uniref:hypothetical protein n=1 Tax=Lacinutrix venerupis TaxID=1486034 RepID=UPI000EB5A85E|nr:hypothetical protein [Lacinutrix venerupis]RLJ62604.1 tetratricopeptide repeat protein [Lacinutrix venerupis]